MYKKTWPFFTNFMCLRQVQAYNQLADFAYSKLNTNDKVFINGYIEDNVVKVKCINVWK